MYIMILICSPISSVSSLTCRVFVSPTSCMFHLLSQYLRAHGNPLKGWHCGFLERLQVATHLAIVSALHMSACTP